MTQILNVLFIWLPRQELKDYLSNRLSHLQNVNLIFPPNLEKTTLFAHALDADIIVGWRPTTEFLETANNLSLFINPGAGVQHLIDMFRELNKIRPVSLINGHGNSYFTAQHAVALLLSLTNKIIPHHNWMHEGQWRKGDSDGISIPLRQRKIGLLGYGKVNQKVHKFLSGFNLEFGILRRNWNRHNESLPIEAGRYNSDQLQSFLKWTDTLIIAVPLTEKTDELISELELNALGTNGLLVNLSRGAVINEKDLYSACKEKKIQGAAIDVWYDYDPDPDETGKKYPYHYPFHNLNNVILSPHRAASPFNDLIRWNEVIDNIERFATGRTDFKNVVSLENEY
jgi:phosphoglycerate dehydrogenase-like enzyme